MEGNKNVTSVIIYSQSCQLKDSLSRQHTGRLPERKLVTIDLDAVNGDWLLLEMLATFLCALYLLSRL